MESKCNGTQMPQMIMMNTDYKERKSVLILKDQRHLRSILKLKTPTQ